jgi:hypothetical protein
MKITKARLVEIIKEEIAGLDEATLGGLFGRGSKAPRSKRTFKGGAADDLDVRAGEVEAGDSTAGLNKAQMKAYSAAIADATADAAKMDSDLEAKLEKEIAANKKDIDAGQQRDSEISDALGELDNLSQDVEGRLGKYFATKTDLRNTLSKLTSQRMIDLIAAKVAEKMPAGATKSATMSPEQRAKLDALRDFEEYDSDFRNE